MTPQTLVHSSGTNPTAPILAGTACPPNIRQSAAFKRIPRERRPIVLSHHTPQYVRYCFDLTAGQRAAEARAAEELVDQSYSPAPVASKSEQVLTYLAKLNRPVTREELATSRACSSNSLRDVLYRLRKNGSIAVVNNAYVLAGRN